MLEVKGIYIPRVTRLVCFANNRNRVSVNAMQICVSVESVQKLYHCLSDWTVISKHVTT